MSKEKFINLTATFIAVGIFGAMLEDRTDILFGTHRIECSEDFLEYRHCIQDEGLIGNTVALGASMLDHILE